MITSSAAASPQYASVTRRSKNSLAAPVRKGALEGK
jgi:hypothetical protein